MVSNRSDVGRRGWEFGKQQCSGHLAVRGVDYHRRRSDCAYGTRVRSRPNSSTRSVLLNATASAVRNWDRSSGSSSLATGVVEF